VARPLGRIRTHYYVSPDFPKYKIVMKKQRLLLDRAAFLQWKYGDYEEDWQSAVELIQDKLSNQNEATISLDELVEEADMIPRQCVLNSEELSQEFKDEYCDCDDDDDDGDFYEISAPSETYYVEWE
tara:strand:- start:612 stop:992 length:381 start_codon:yes stop_codon:yes gene_type:complete